MTQQQRTPPHSVDAEECVLGAMLLAPQARAAVLERGLEARHFYNPQHGHVFAAMLLLEADGRDADPVTVGDELRRLDLLESVGGVPALLHLESRTPATSNAGHYADIVMREARYRHAIVAAGNVEEAGYEGSEELLAAAGEALLEAMSEGKHRRSAAVTGDEFVLSESPTQLAVWGHGEEILWAAGEMLMLNGPPGVGKTTLGQQVALGRMGLRSEVLDFPVLGDERRVFYIAADRPAQARRSLRRMVGEDQRAELHERLTVWQGPLPADVGEDPGVLLRLARQYGAGTVVVDSLKDIAMEISRDDVGAKVNLACQHLVANDIEVMLLHHQRKRQQGMAKPKKLDDVYGSIWVPAGAGSVVVLWGEAGDPIVELSHLKQPAEPVGPLTLLHDHTTGTTTVQHGVDLYDMVKMSNGLTAEGAARGLCGTDTPTANDTAKARRKLERLCTDGRATRRGGGRGEHGRQEPARYYAVVAEPF